MRGGKKTISMLCAGTGLTPMFQALWKLLGTPGDDRQVVLMYGNKSVEDILMKEELNAWSKRAAGRPWPVCRMTSGAIQ